MVTEVAWRFRMAVGRGVWQYRSGDEEGRGQPWALPGSLEILPRIKGGARREAQSCQCASVLREIRARSAAWTKGTCLPIDH